MTGSTLAGRDAVSFRSDAAGEEVRVGQVLVDFHVHTPVSRCYSERDASPADIVSVAAGSGVDAIVVNDHHSAAALDDLRAAGEGLQFPVLPGVEITTRQGHIVGAFDSDTPVGVIWDLLRDLGVPERHHGNGHHQIRPLMVDVAEGIAAAGGLAIPAHVDRWPNGFMEAQMSRRERLAVLQHPDVHVIEITLPHTQDDWQRGAIPGYETAIACIQGSDAHALAEIGRRSTRVRAAGFQMAAFREAFQQVTGVTELVEWRT